MPLRLVAFFQTRRTQKLVVISNCYAMIKTDAVYVLGSPLSMATELGGESFGSLAG